MYGLAFSPFFLLEEQIRSATGPRSVGDFQRKYATPFESCKMKAQEVLRISYVWPGSIFFSPRFVPPQPRDTC